MGALSEATIRRAETHDISDLHRLIERAYRGDDAKQGWTHEADLLGGQRTDRAALAALIADPAHAILIAEHGGAIVGCVEIADSGQGLAYLGLLSVDPALQTGGLGRALIAAAEAAAIKLFGATRMEMVVIGTRAELIAWYERRGYRRSGERRPFEYPAERLTTTDLSFAVLERALS